MQIQNQLPKILRSVASAALSFLAGLGIYSGVQSLSSSSQPKTIPLIENLQREQTTPINKPEPERKPRPILGDSCTTCGMG